MGPASVIIVAFMFFMSSFNHGQESEYFGQFRQDEIVNERFFKNKRGGVFIDIGAADGISGSNTYFFEKNLAWTGICIEPLEKTFKKLLENRKCVVVGGCIWHTPGTLSFYKVSYNNEEVGLSGLVEPYPKEHMKNIQQTYQTEVIDVFCYRLNDICREHGIFKIDYMSIDTEGADLEILKSIDFDVLDIDVIDVENNFDEPYIREFLESKGYMFVVRAGVDDIYRKATKYKDEL